MFRLANTTRVIYDGGPQLCQRHHNSDVSSWTPELGSAVVSLAPTGGGIGAIDHTGNCLFM